MNGRRILKSIFKPLVVVVAAVYFVIDALILAALRPLLKRILHLRLFRTFAGRIEQLGPYATLALFLVPLVLLEPVKPLAAYLIASEHFATGTLVLVVGEFLKIVIVERVYQIGRPKLMTIKAFAWTHDRVAGWLGWLKALPPWQSVRRTFADMVQWMKKLIRAARHKRAVSRR